MRSLSIPALLLGIVIANPSYAALTNYFCGANHQYINIGDDTSKIQTACGKPDTIEKPQPGQQLNTPNPNQVWTYQAVVNPMQTVNTNLYYSNPNNPLRNGMNSANPFGNNNTLNNSYNGPTFTVTIQNNQVTSVQGNQHNCGNWNPYPGVSSQAVLNHCGQPISIRPLAGSINPYNNKIENWTYNNPYGPALQLQLTNGKLTAINLGNSTQ